MSYDLSEEELKALYSWLDGIPLSRKKRNISRDFSDGVLLAEVVHAYFPHLVELHNYQAANSIKQKILNFETLNHRVLRKLGYSIPREAIDKLVEGRPGVIESVLNQLQFKMAKYREKQNNIQNREVPERANPVAVNGAAQQASARGFAPQPSPHRLASAVDDEILAEKEKQIRELQETIEIQEIKISKLEQLVRIKDNKIQKLLAGQSSLS